MEIDNNGKLVRELIVAYDARQEKILQTIGEISGDIKAIKAEFEESHQKINELSNAVKKANQRIDRHLKDHQENDDIMGAGPFIRKNVRKHWKMLFFGLLFAQIAIAGLLLRYGIEKIISWLKG